MRHTHDTYRHLGLASCMLMLWMLAGWFRAAINPCHACQQATLVGICSSSLEHKADISADQGTHHQYARAAERVTLSGERGGSSLGESQVRTSGGHPMAAVRCAYVQRQVSRCFSYHFMLASAGVVYITPRACDYYVFALRRILD